MTGTALEVAMALWRMPSMREALRQRPLPDGVGEVVELAGGASDRVARAAAQLQEPPEAVLEAARFYVREVLLVAGSDAYRVLGLAPDASGAQIKTHHRALQHWLHPDRRGNDWDAAFATRINTAWTMLRTPERRARYDAQHAPGSAARAVDTPRRVLVTGWRAVTPIRSQRWRAWVASGMALVACLWLLVLAQRQAGAPAPSWDPVAIDLEASDTAVLAAVLAGMEQLPARLAGDVEPASAAGPHASTPVHDVDRAAPDAASPPPHARLPARPAAADPVAPMPGANPSVAIATNVPATQARSASEAAAARQAIVNADPAAAMPDETPQLDAPAPEQVRLARLRGREITRYLGGDGDRAPPIWNNVTALDAADALRMRFAEGESGSHASLRFGDPDWRIAGMRATMTSAVLDVGGTPVAGRLRVEMAWRDGMWLVDTLQVEPAP